jgi:hypothetical protein
MERRIHITLHTKPEGKFKQYCTFYTTNAKKTKSSSNAIMPNDSSWIESQSPTVISQNPETPI